MSGKSHNKLAPVFCLQILTQRGPKCISFLVARCVDHVFDGRTILLGWAQRMSFLVVVALTLFHVLTNHLGREICSSGCGAGTNQEGRTGPTIEEIPDDAPVDEQAQSSSRRRSGGSQEPIVEHPDDEEETQHRRRSDHHRSHARDHHGANDVASRPAGGAQVFSFSSVQSYSRDGSGPGNYYSKSTTTRMGPDGVADQQTREQDSRSNTDKLKYVRALGSKARSVLRTRKADGEEESLQTLHNLEEEEAATFDDQWQQKAERALPRWYDGSGRALPDQSGGRSSRMALPANSSGGRNTRARGVRQA